MKRLILLLASMLLIGGVTQAASPATVTAASATSTGQLNGDRLRFAYADETGQRLLNPEGDGKKRYAQAIYAPGKIADVRYVKQQKRAEDSNGRQNQWNFDRDAGELYAVVKGKIPGNESVLLAEKGAFQGHEFLNYKPLSKGAFAKGDIAGIEKAKKRKVAQQALLGQVSKNLQIGLVTFERKKGQKPLASLVLKTESGLLFEDFEGNDDDQSTWRVDDGGTIAPDMFKILFVTKSKAGYALSYEWIGEEGYSLTVLQQNKTKFRSVMHGYRYAAPV
ncbi:hypothetical protein [Cohnella terricola]|uniref:Uncharacterized protein n=1 Tax=Cohnella terricola TaxID=1289167 RepID=A0A559JTT3_9BACL|nr:hypothetical protein [Cohnella terricola]TVY03294.1 hypothetical protein FPZ45_05315 [Cohnella terricola]